AVEAGRGVAGRPVVRRGDTQALEARGVPRADGRRRAPAGVAGLRDRVRLAGHRRRVAVDALGVVAVGAVVLGDAHRGRRGDSGGRDADAADADESLHAGDRRAPWVGGRGGRLARPGAGAHQVAVAIGRRRARGPRRPEGHTVPAGGAGGVPAVPRAALLVVATGFAGRDEARDAAG